MDSSGVVQIADHGMVEISYYWALSILSGRSLDQLTQLDFNKLMTAFRALSATPNKWTAPLRVVRRYLECLIDQGDSGDPDVTGFSLVRSAHEALEDAHRVEISRHLEMIISAGVEDGIAKRDTDRVNSLRMDGRRRERVEMFFEADPAPVKRRDVPRFYVDVADWVKLVGGGACCALAVGVGFRAALSNNAFFASALFLLCLATGYAAFILGYARLRFEQVEEADERPWSAHWNPGRDTWREAGQRAHSDEQERFAQQVNERVEFQFSRSQPAGESQTEAWDSYTAPFRQNLKQELVELYRTEIPPGGAAAVDWLIRMRVEQATRRRRNEATNSRENESLLPSGEVVALALLAVFAGAALVMAVKGPDIEGGFTAGLLALIGFLPAGSGVGAVLREQVRLQADKEHAAKLFDAERRARERLVAHLANRPSDMEMASWLDYDKAFVKSLALDHYGLTNRDIVEYVTLTEGSPEALRARVPFGPPRYSHYLVSILLLTDSGVRQFALELDAGTGNTQHENRTAFRYESIASVKVSEVGVQYHGNSRSVVVVDSAEATRSSTPTKLTFRHALILRLTSGEIIPVLVDRIDLNFISQFLENRLDLVELAKDTSGITAAVKILEAVAVDGPQWIEMRRLRRRRLTEEFRTHGSWEGGAQTRDPRAQIGNHRLELGSMDEDDL